MDISISDLKVILNQHSDSERTLFEIPELQIPERAKVLIKGSSGQGKSTFLHLIAGLLRPTQGLVKIGTTDLTTLTENERCLFRRHNISMIFQKLNLLEHLNVVENIQLSQSNSHKENSLAQLIMSLGLSGKEKQKAKTLSLGEQQRVAIARALISNNPLILGDEPTSSLDDRNTEEVMRLLIEQSTNRTLIVVSHDPRIEKYFSVKINFGDFSR